jgi:hypothetical protein
MHTWLERSPNDRPEVGSSARWIDRACVDSIEPTPVDGRQYDYIWLADEAVDARF